MAKTEKLGIEYNPNGDPQVVQHYFEEAEPEKQDRSNLTLVQMVLADLPDDFHLMAWEVTPRGTGRVVELLVGTVLLGD